MPTYEKKMTPDLSLLPLLRVCYDAGTVNTIIASGSPRSSSVLSIVSTTSRRRRPPRPHGLEMLLALLLVFVSLCGGNMAAAPSLVLAYVVGGCSLHQSVGLRSQLTAGTSTCADGYLLRAARCCGITARLAAAAPKSVGWSCSDGRRTLPTRRRGVYMNAAAGEKGEEKMELAAEVCFCELNARKGRRWCLRVVIPIIAYGGTALSI